LNLAEKEYLLGNKAKEMLIYTTKITMNTNLFPKHARFTFVHELQNTSKKILRNIHAANECLFITEYRKRIELIKEVLDDCNYMLQMIEICLELEFIDLRRCKYWCELVLNVKYMCASWRKKDSERAVKLIEDEELKKLERQKQLVREIVEEVLKNK
jgi:hypothetical protein